MTGLEPTDQPLDFIMSLLFDPLSELDDLESYKYKYLLHPCTAGGLVLSCPGSALRICYVRHSRRASANDNISAFD